MLHNAFRGASLAVLLCLFLSAPVRALDPVIAFAGEFLLGKVVEEGWNRITGKPDVAFIQRRIMELENNAVLKEDMRAELRKLRDEVREREQGRAIELPRMVDQLPQVGQLTFAQELRHQHAVVARERQRFVDQLGDWHAVLPGSQVF